jgi:predicted enzyme related to lactoylglutathione lyase
MIGGVATVWVPAKDVGRAADFYRDKLEFDVKQQNDDWAEIDANGLMIGINAREEEGAGASGGPVIAFQVEDSLESAVEELKGRGVEFDTEISDHPWGRLVNFNDSEGNDLQLYEPPS